jgi:hypothetical protein
MPLPPWGAGFTRFWGVEQAFFTPDYPDLGVFGGLPLAIAPQPGAAFQGQPAL